MRPKLAQHEGLVEVESRKNTMLEFHRKMFNMVEIGLGFYQLRDVVDTSPRELMAALL
jgi:uncharacterized protein YecE (DUF72 family)